MLAGGTAPALLWAGGENSLNAIQTISILTALPFSIVIVFMCISLFKSLQAEHRLFIRAQRRQVRNELADEISENVNSQVEASFSQLEEQWNDRMEAEAAEAAENAVEARTGMTTKVDGKKKKAGTPPWRAFDD
ncbi:MAG: BCCT family transporter [Kocuria sp.]|nr:BCCT family transporter [Kocuria sp.]